MKELKKSVSQAEMQPFSDKNPFFSVVIPVYNKEPHVRRAVFSVINQTYTNHEILIINDASTDGSVAEIQKIQDFRIRVFNRDQPGPGGYAARNLGISEARADWVAFLDADDEWHPEHLQNMFTLHAAFPASGFLSCGWQERWHKDKIDDDAYFRQNATRGAHQIAFSDYLHNAIKNKRPVYTSVAVMQKSLAQNIFPHGQAKRGGDLHAFLMLMAKTTMAWSPHLGSVYHRDSVNMVTKSAPASPDLAIKAVSLLASKTTAREMGLLKKYANRRIWNAFRARHKVGGEQFSLANALFWKNDFLFCVRCLLFACVQAISPDKKLI